MKNGVPQSPKWSVGIITAPRKGVSHIDKTLQCLINAGWNNIVVFAEPNSPIPLDSSIPVVQRPRFFGDWTNWATGLYELLLSEPDSDYFFMAEDDGVICKGAKSYLDQVLPILGDFATVSPYCPNKHRRKNFIGFHNECIGWETWSTLTVIMSKESVIRFFSDSDVQRHRFEHIFPVPADQIPWGVEVDPKNSVKDAVLGLWAAKNGLPMYYHSPSLVQHIGMTSTLTSKTTTEANLAFDFVGEDFEPNWEGVKVLPFTNGMLKL